jgi:hypothetical protein
MTKRPRLITHITKAEDRGLGVVTELEVVGDITDPHDHDVYVDVQWMQGDELVWGTFKLIVWKWSPREIGAETQASLNKPPVGYYRGPRSRASGRKRRSPAD